METEEKKKSYWWILLLIAGLLVIGYGVGVWHFSQYTYPKTTVNAKEVGGKPKKSFYLRYPSDKQYTFTGPHQTLTLSAKDIEGSWSLASPAPEEPSPWLWPVEIFQRHDYEVEYKPEYNDALLEERLIEAGFDPEGPAPKNAEIVVDEKGATIQPEELGDRVNMPKMKQLVLEGLASDRSEIDASSVFEKPERTAEDPALTEEVAQLNQLLNVSVSYSVGTKTYVLGPEEIYPLLEKQEDGEYILPDESIENFVVEMAKETDTYGTTREFESTGAGTVSVPPGIYGWQINVADTTKELKKMLDDGGQYEDVQPVYNHEGMARGELNDIGATYIEVDLSRQHLWGYVDGNLLLDSDVKTGLVNDYNETPRGVHMIWSRETDRNLKGHYKNGEPYDSHVDYWMPINYGGVGLHDAPWVSVFGGDQYLYSGSNGCINLPRETAKAIYENYSVGTPVVIYESTTNYSPADTTY